jgi:hypothetical protein
MQLLPKAVTPAAAQAEGGGSQIGSTSSSDASAQGRLRSAQASRSAGVQVTTR